MAKGYYVYRQFNKRTGEYYIGKGTYSDRDPDGSKYRGSGILLLRKMNAHPNDFEKEILKEFDEGSEAYDYEAELVGERYIGGADHDPLCLNMNSGGTGTSRDFMRAYYSDPKRREERSIESKKKWQNPEYRAKWQASEEASREKRIENLKETLKDPEVRARIKASANCPKKRAKLHRKNKSDTIPIEKDGVEIEIPREQLADYFRLGWSLCSKGVVNIHHPDIGIYSCGQHDVVKHLVLEHGFKFGTHYDLERVNYDVISKLAGVREIKSKGQMGNWSLKPVKLINLEGEVELVPRDVYLDKLEEGYTFKSQNLQVRNHTLKQTCNLGKGKAKRVLLQRGDWELGSKRGYEAISTKSLK